MASTKLTGQIYRIDPVAENNGYKSRTFVLYVRNERDERYSDYFLIELRGDKCAILDTYQVGATVDVSLDIRGRKYDKKDGSGEGFFTSLSAYGIAQPQAPWQRPAMNPQQYAAAPPPQYANAQPMWGTGSVNYPPTNAAAVAAGQMPVMGQAPEDAPF